MRRIAQRLFLDATIDLIPLQQSSRRTQICRRRFGDIGGPSASWFGIAFGGVSVGEFSPKDWRIESGAILAGVAVGLLVAVPLVLFYLIRIRFSGSLSHDGVEALSLFLLYALILGAVITLSLFLHGCYQKGTRSRLFFGMASGMLLILYSFMVLVTSRLTSVLSDIGLQLDTTFAAAMVTYASAMVMFSAGGEYLSSRRTWEESVGAAKAGPGSSQ